MKKILSILSLIFLSIFLYSCQNNESYDVVTTIFPYYDIVNQIGQDKIKTKLLSPIGSDIHIFEPTSKDIININNASLFIYTSNDVDPWVKKLNINVKTINLETHYGWHKWTDPIAITSLIDEITKNLVSLKPMYKSFFLNNANKYKNKLLKLDKMFTDLLKDETIYYAGHLSHDSFAHRYNLEIIALDEEIEPNVEVTAKQWIDLIESIKNNNIKYLFFEELIDPIIAKKIQKQLKKEKYDLKIMLLHGIHNVSIDEWNNNISYYDIQYRNYLNLKEALDANS